MLLVLIILKYFLFFILGAYVLRLIYSTVRGYGEVFIFLRGKEMAVVPWVVICAFVTMLIYQVYGQLVISNPYFA